MAVDECEPLEALMPLIQGGDAAAFERLYDATAPQVLGLITQILRDRAQAEEVTQELFIELWQHAAEYDPARGSAKSWILRRARMRAIDRLRSVLSTLHRDDREAFLIASATVESVENQALNNVERRGIREALDLVGEPHKTAILLAYFGGLTQAELARTTGVPLGTAKTRVRDGLRKLEKILVQRRLAPQEGGTP
ncbi:sigma-70 family RNA polymerase sigma factor [Corynebacterium sp. zg-331]|uniref:sigma-70 family RNA polymerase sigma factor n=1 Tax=unclassified Corynebacterium TaxID=2624378 RepID=UPI00128C2274|nr:MULTISPECIES: sigma-70 family RNA polymerase sigma factor [unclassified Corynebacterium]MBC3186668.1 sigma-70 family RNA polymerase sigma factor [Corynebacterium sp. zg-331]MPV53152.1 sigma-70 family RNA polymerase sigma factor [Corynebacterium sp. zg331]